MTASANRPRSALWTPWAVATLAGVAAYAVGVLATLLVSAIDGAGVPLSGAVERVGRASVDPGAVAAAGGRPVPGVVEGLLPAAVLVAAGYAVASGFVGADARQGARAGGAVALGYVAAVVAAGTTAPGAVAAVGAYAAVAGGVGGALGRSR